MTDAQGDDGIGDMTRSTCTASNSFITDLLAQIKVYLRNSYKIIVIFLCALCVILLRNVLLTEQVDFQMLALFIFISSFLLSAIYVTDANIYNNIMMGLGIGIGISMSQIKSFLPPVEESTC
jgi:hypothetical protein